MWVFMYVYLIFARLKKKSKFYKIFLDLKCHKSVFLGVLFLAHGGTEEET